MMQESSVRRSDHTGCELYSGTHCHGKGVQFYPHRQNWNLLLNKGGRFELTMEGHSLVVEPDTLLLLEPGPKRIFSDLDDWQSYWVHFNMDPYISIMPEWPMVIPHVYRCLPHSSDLVKIQYLLDEIREQCRVRKRGWYRLGYCMVQEIILRGNMVLEKGLAPQDIELTLKLLEHLDDAGNMDELARKCSLSRAGFFAKFKESFGMSPGVYRDQMLMSKAQELLADTDLSIKEIAARLKMGSAYYLSTKFKKNYGMSPTRYRLHYRQSMANDDRTEA